VFALDIVLRILLLFVCFNGVDVVIVGVRRWVIYYINFGAGPNITCISNISLSLGQMINYIMYAPSKEVHIVVY